MKKFLIVFFFVLIQQCLFNSLSTALNTKNPFVISSTCRVIQHMCMCSKYQANMMMMNTQYYFQHSNVEKLSRFSISHVFLIFLVVHTFSVGNEKCLLPAVVLEKMRRKIDEMFPLRPTINSLNYRSLHWTRPRAILSTISANS